MLSSSNKAMMDWYNGLDTEDFVVPKDEELVDVFPSEDSWQQWGMSGSQNFGWPMRFEPLKKGDLPEDKMVFGKANGQNSLQESETQNDFGMSGGWPSAHWCENSMAQDNQDHPEFQFNDQMRNDQMDDIFMDSLLKEDPTATENNNVISSHLCSETQFSPVSADSDSENLMIDFQSAPGVIKSIESSRNFGTGHVGTSNVSKNISMGLDDPHLAKACPSKVLHSSYNHRSNGGYGSVCTGEEISLEEAVLNDLGETLTQLSTNTRLCFRDSFYRLAQNSTKQMLLSGEVKDASPYDLTQMEVDDEQLRSGELVTAESETNTIDRAVANFVFKKVDVNTQDLRLANKRKCESVDENKGTKYISFGPPQIFEYPST